MVKQDFFTLILFIFDSKFHACCNLQKEYIYIYNLSKKTILYKDTIE